MEEYAAETLIWGGYEPDIYSDRMVWSIDVNADAEERPSNPKNGNHKD
jgi:hypothetical protein